jgi:hypothetical protein
MEKYLSNKQEIMAYASEIADDMFKKFGKEKSLKYLKSYIEYREELKEVVPLNMYEDWIENKNSPIIKRLFKYVYDYLEDEK